MTDIASITQASEEAVRAYFAQKNWSWKKLDKPSHKAITAADWLFEYHEYQFLCEVKTITSVRKGLHTEAHFTAFNRQLEIYFSDTSIAKEPLSVQIHSDDVYQPTTEQAQQFINWLEEALLKIKAKLIPVGWICGPLPWGEYLLSSWYSFSPSSEKTSPKFSVHVSTGNTNGFELYTHIYGGLHTSKIHDNITKARNQLAKTATRQANPNVARVVVLRTYAVEDMCGSIKQ